MGLTEIVALLKDAGPLTIMCVMWYLANRRADKLQAERDNLLERTLATSNTLSETVKSLLRIVGEAHD